MYKKYLDTNNSIRLDKFLWFIRIFKSRSLASKACSANKVKTKTKASLKASYIVKIGDIYTTGYKEIEVLAIPKIRCNYESSKLYYKILKEERPVISNNANTTSKKTIKPSKKQRRNLVKFLQNQ